MMNVSPSGGSRGVVSESMAVEKAVIAVREGKTMAETGEMAEGARWRAREERVCSVGGCLRDSMAGTHLRGGNSGKE